MSSVRCSQQSPVTRRDLRHSDPRSVDETDGDDNGGTRDGDNGPHSGELEDA